MSAQGEGGREGGRKDDKEQVWEGERASGGRRD